MASTEKVSISIADAEILAWAKDRARRHGVSVSAVFVEALDSERQFELQLAARERVFAASGVAAPTQKEALAILAEWDVPLAGPSKKKGKILHRAKHPGARPVKATAKRRTKAKTGKRRDK
jgi:hypothetical protein